MDKKEDKIIMTIKSREQCINTRKSSSKVGESK